MWSIPPSSLNKIHWDIPGLFNTFNEILVNSKDQVTRLNELYKKNKSVQKVTEIKVKTSRLH